jgi:hypothetical protein
MECAKRSINLTDSIGSRFAACPFQLKMLTSLPHNTLSELFKWIDTTSLCRLICTCKQLQLALDKEENWKEIAKQFEIFPYLEKITKDKWSWKLYCLGIVYTNKHPHKKQFQRRINRCAESYNILNLQQDCTFSYTESDAYDSGGDSTNYFGIYLLSPKTNIISMWYFKRHYSSGSIWDEVATDTTYEREGTFQANFVDSSTVHMCNYDLFTDRKKSEDLYRKAMKQIYRRQ